ncbi:MAG: response regulator [Pseudomonadota bacterium]
MRESTDDSLVILSTLPANPRERRIALGLSIVSVLVFLALAPFAKLPLPKIPAFIPIYESALVVNDLITAVLLFGQFAILRSKALLALAGAYLFTALLTVAHALSFPGLFAAGGLLGAGSQSTVWLYMFWHGGFPLMVLAYVQLCGKGAAVIYPGRAGREIMLCILGICALVLACMALATAGHDWLPVLLGPQGYTPSMYLAVGTAWALSLCSLLVLWRRKSQTVLDLWLMVVMCAWLADIALAAGLNAARFDLGFYFGRIYGLLASGFVLMMLLLENGMLYARLLAAHQRERQKSADLQSLSLELESTNGKLNESNQQLQEASRLKSEFLANMSHELRTPLNAVIGFSEVLKDGLVGPLSSKQTEFTQQIFHSGRHLLSLINDILDLSKIEAGKMVLDLEPVELDALLQESFAVPQAQAQARGISLDFDNPLGGRTLLADSRKLKQMLYNLLSNAIKFTADGGQVTLKLAICRRGQVALAAEAPASARLLSLPAGEFQDFLQISVCDTGVGIGSADMMNLFQTFRQVDASLTRRHEGTGLGLAMVSRLAALHGGTVGLRSTPGLGSEFVLWLPWREAGAGPASAVLPEGLTAALPTPAGSRQRALVIEDNQQAAQLLRLHLESAGFDVHSVQQCSDAVTEAQRLLPDLITLDLHFPEASGWELLEIFKADPQLRDIPVVIVSILVDEEKGLALGAARILQKPVAREVLLAALHDLRLPPADPGQTQLTVLIIDDEPQAVELIAANLEGLNYRLLRAYDGATAIRVARQEMPDLIILDLLMPDMDGFQVVEALRREARPVLAPILVLTAKSLTREDKQRLHGGVTQILEKASLNREDFLSEVRRAVQTEQAL